MRSEGYCSCPVGVGVCVCVRGPHLRVAQLSSKLHILAVSVSCSLVFKFGVFRIMAKIAIAFPYLRAHGSRPFLYAKQAHFPHSFRILRS